MHVLPSPILSGLLFRCKYVILSEKKVSILTISFFGTEPKAEGCKLKMFWGKLSSGNCKGGVNQCPEHANDVCSRTSTLLSII